MKRMSIKPMERTPMERMGVLSNGGPTLVTLVTGLCVGSTPICVGPRLSSCAR